MKKLLNIKCNSCDGIYKDSLDVRFTKVCDNQCPFCIERFGIDCMDLNVSKMIHSTIQSGKKDILILGGEPLLFMHKVLEYVIGIRNYVDHIYITTSLPKTIDDDYETFQVIMENIDGLNVSLQHYDYKKNNAVLCAKSKHNRIQLLEKIANCNNYAEKIRVSINLVRGQIDTYILLKEFLMMMKSMNILHVKINELQHEDELYVSFEEITGLKLKSPYSHGCQTDIALIPSLRTTVKRSCFLVNDKLTASLSDVCKAMYRRLHKPQNTCTVLYENGVVSEGWEQKR